ncbi:hypothetical protein NPX13_g6639 [Xylaria arbuscula]|uniref:Uncharacterized protein n=1 Tax=Xylaria arbuscula TaxID=114810 RepID=A0A9W8NBH0_9PEZI|nr:hypothetical protein NPX13_g6639 [Xylaria arbuscula]
MPADDYVSAGAGGALKLKGAKVQKSKKKSKSKDKDKSASIERALSGTPAADAQPEKGDIDDAKKAATPGVDSDPEPEYKTEAERRHEEAMKKKVSAMDTYLCLDASIRVDPELTNMQRMLDDPALASEIRKTHKERVESLNTYLSKLSEHHDMPKIGPG